jgi:hypothetical protein
MTLDTKRLDELFEMGLRFNGSEYDGKVKGVYINFHHTEIAYDSDKVWNGKITKVKEHLKNL